MEGDYPALTNVYRDSRGISNFTGSHRNLTAVTRETQAQESCLELRSVLRGEVETKGNGGADKYSEIWGLRLTPLCISNYYKKTVVFQMLNLSISFRDSDEPRVLSLRLGK